jgi:hypothetical protein
MTVAVPAPKLGPERPRRARTLVGIGAALAVAAAAGAAVWRVNGAGPRRAGAPVGTAASAPSPAVAPGTASRTPADRAADSAAALAAAAGLPPLRPVDSAARRAGDSARAAARRATSATLTIAVPADADVYVDGARVGRGSVQDAVRPGRHVVRAAVASLPGCPSADTSMVVDLTSGGGQTVYLDPVACGRLTFDVVPTPAEYRLVPSRGGPAVQGLLPLGEPLFLPEGDYALTIEATQCAAYTASVPVVAGRARTERARLICS